MSGVYGILEEADDVAGEVDDRKVLDAALIAAAQAVEHYEITRYGSLIAWAAATARACWRKTSKRRRRPIASSR